MFEGGYEVPLKFKEDGMRYPTIDQLASKVNSKYRLVIGVAKRARQIRNHEKILLDEYVNQKSIGIALEEINAGVVKIAKPK